MARWLAARYDTPSMAGNLVYYRDNVDILSRGVLPLTPLEQQRSADSQILTISELLAGTGITYSPPLQMNCTFKKWPRVRATPA